MNEIYQAFGVPVIPVNWNNGYWLSADLWATFDYVKVLVGDVPCVVARPLRDVPPVNTLLGQFRKVRLEEDVPVILEVDRLSWKRRKELLSANIPFISPREIYLPFLGMKLEQNTGSKRMAQRFLTPLSQQLFFMLLYQRGISIPVDSIPGRLGSDALPVADALNHLQQIGFVEIDNNSGNYVSANRSMPLRALYVLAKPHLISPVLSVSHVNGDGDTRLEELPLAGETALSEYSMLAPPRGRTVACDCLMNENPGSLKPVGRNNQDRVELWAYSPTRISGKEGVADALSVVSSLYGFAANEDDPRLDKAIDEALDEVLGRE